MDVDGAAAWPLADNGADGAGAVVGFGGTAEEASRSGLLASAVGSALAALLIVGSAAGRETTALAGLLTGAGAGLFVAGAFCGATGGLVSVDLAGAAGEGLVCVAAGAAAGFVGR